MKTFPLKISSPEGDLFSGEAVKIILRTTEGELAILAGHIPFVSSVIECTCKIETPDGEEKTAHTSGGLLTVSSDRVLFLTGTLEFDK